MFSFTDWLTLLLLLAQALFLVTLKQLCKSTNKLNLCQMPLKCNRCNLIVLLYWKMPSFYLYFHNITCMNEKKRKSHNYIIKLYRIQLCDLICVYHATYCTYFIKWKIYLFERRMIIVVIIGAVLDQSSYCNYAHTRWKHADNHIYIYSETVNARENSFTRWKRWQFFCIQ